MPRRHISYQEFLACSISEPSETNHPSITQLRRFRQLHGVPPSICCTLWRRIWPQLSPFTKPKHLLWALRFLKSYNTEAVNADVFNVTETTTRSWIWNIVELLADINLVRHYILYFLRCHYQFLNARF